jgi:hypothetical protein
MPPIHNQISKGLDACFMIKINNISEKIIGSLVR